MEVALALLAALLFSVATVLQRKVATTVPDDEAMSAGLLLKLARRPLWLVGVAADGAGFAAQAAALAVGRLVVVQPVLATTLVFTLPLGARLDGRRITRRELGGALAVTLGIVVFLVAADPGAGTSDATTRAWVVSGALVALACGGLMLLARGRDATTRAALLGSATGILFGLTAALTKAVVDDLDDGAVAVLTDWRLYALIVAGWASMTFSQASLQTGALAPAVATQMALNPIASLLLGTLAFHEQIHHEPAGVVAALLGIVAMTAGLVVLASAQASAESATGAARTRAST